MQVTVRVLGPLQAVVNGVDVTPAAPKERALLALFVINRGVVVGADRLMEELWPALVVDRARRVLQVRVAAVRKLLATSGAASLLELVPPGYRFDIGDDDVDEHRFLTLVEQARARDRSRRSGGRGGHAARGARVVAGRPARRRPDLREPGGGGGPPRRGSRRARSRTGSTPISRAAATRPSPANSTRSS